MNASEQLPLHQLPSLQPAALQASPDAAALPLQTLPPELHNLDAIAANGLFSQRYHDPHALHPPHPFDHHAHFAPFAAQYQQPQQPQPPQPQPQHLHTPFAQLSAPSIHHQQPQHQQQQQEQEQQQQDPYLPVEGPPVTNHGQFEGLRLIPNPPNLEQWREKLFFVDDTITLNQEDFQTYFPHIDNVYSHRSTQRHKRKRFVSHYWDCRLKGRPPGTKKSTDPDKKKRKRVARERDLCDVKIKITEFFDGRELEEQTGIKVPDGESTNAGPVHSDRVSNLPDDANAFFGQQQHVASQQAVGTWGVQGMEPTAMSMAPTSPVPPRKYYTIQRVNGNGGNGKGDGVAGPHKHTLEESDRVKKNSVVRWLAKAEKDSKKVQGGDSTKKTYHKKATGNALTTVKNHSKEDDLKLYGSCFCPFVQRVWISLEHKNIPYQYVEVDPYKKPQSLLDVNPRGLVPAIRHGPTWSTHESTVIMEYLEDLQTGPPLLPPDAQTRATCRLWSDHVNRNIIPNFYRLLQAQDPSDQVNHATELRNEISKLVSAAHPSGPFFLGPQFSFVDAQIAPWVIRLRRVLGPYRGWPEPEEGSRWKVWVDAIEAEQSVRMTTSDDGLYLDSYERYAENRPNTSMLASAVNEGRGLP